MNARYILNPWAIIKTNKSTWKVIILPCSYHGTANQCWNALRSCWKQYCREVFISFNSNGSISVPEWCDGFFGPYCFTFQP